MASVALTPQSLDDVRAFVAPHTTWRSLMDWPPDAAALMVAILSRSGAYRVVVSPPDTATWPPPMRYGTADWSASVQKAGERWAAWTQAAGKRKSGTRMPRELAAELRVIQGGAGVPLSDLGTTSQWDLTCSVITLLAMADEACAGIRVPASTASAATSFRLAAGGLLSQTSSLARLPTDRIRVMPKERSPRSGITIRSLTRHIAVVESSEVKPIWVDAVDIEEAGRDHATLLLVPWPKEVNPTDFRLAPGPLLNMDPDGYAFFEYEPKTPVDQAELERIVKAAREKVGKIDAVVFPESVFSPAQLLAVRRTLKASGNPTLIAGVRQRARPPHTLGSNMVYIASASSVPGRAAAVHIRQYKHHRWFLDRSQIEQYHLGSSLDPNLMWWEAIDVSARQLTFMTMRNWLTICPLVCEDLARPDPVADLIRATGPSLVIALLLDGPQLAKRWPSRYATVLADDPGSAVLTLASIGMVERARPAGKPRSRVVGLWKQRAGSPIEISLEEGAQAIALTISRETNRSTTADGRVEADTRTYDAFLSGIEQIG